jgi:hypothetical protein
MLTAHDRDIIARARELASLTDLDVALRFTRPGDVSPETAILEELDQAQSLLDELAGLAERLAGPAEGGATIALTAVELRALFNLLSFVATGGATTETPDRQMAARLRARLETALGEAQGEEG